MDFRLLRVSTRIQLLIALVLVGLLAVSTTSLLHLKSTLLLDRKEKIRNLVEGSHALLAHFHARQKSGELSEADAKAAAIGALKALRYDGKEYFWINDSGTPVPRMVMHPASPALDATLLDAEKFHCATSLQAGVDGRIEKTDGRKNLFVAFVEVASRAGHGYVTYDWPKPKEGGGTTVELYPKLSYVMKFKEWDWIVGTGIYVDDVDRLFREEAFLLGGMSLFGIVLLSLIGWRIGTSILQQLGGEPASAVRIMQQVAQGDLTVSMDNPPAGSLLAALGEMVGNLRGLITEIHASGKRVVANAESIKTASEQIAIAAQHQSDATSSMAAGIEQLTVSSSEISENARNTEHDSRDAMTLADEGSRRVAEAMTAIQNVAATVTEAAERIRVLEERANQVSSIANEIKEIAGQTNLLALNAAIEAARAGEQGRGFAVVADEVRKLAERTATATTEIEQMIAGIQADTSASVQAMKDVLPRVEDGVRLAGAASESLSTIENGASRTLERVADVALATREQSIASTSLAQRVEHIAQMVEQTTASVQQTAETAAELESIALDLESRIDRFRV